MRPTMLCATLAMLVGRVVTAQIPHYDEDSRIARARLDANREPMTWDELQRVRNSSHYKVIQADRNIELDFTRGFRHTYAEHGMRIFVLPFSSRIRNKFAFHLETLDQTQQQLFVVELSSACQPGLPLSKRDLQVSISDARAENRADLYFKSGALKKAVLEGNALGYRKSTSAGRSRGLDIFPTPPDLWTFIDCLIFNDSLPVDDFSFIDGGPCAACGWALATFVESGGFLAVDEVNTFCPMCSDFMSPLFTFCWFSASCL